MSLGILRVAAQLEVNGYGVEMVDLSGIANYTDAIADHVSLTSANVFGLTATTPQMPAAGKIRETIRACRPDARIILGGPHITLVHAAYKREAKLGINGRATRTLNKLLEQYDVLVAGDGEEAIFLAVSKKPAKLIDADDPSTALFLTNSRLNELPWPARHLVDVQSYNYTIEGERALSLIAQLGCPFACSFCGGRESPMLRRIRMRSAENVVGEIRHLHERYGVSAAMAYDDELNVNPKMVELMNAIAKLGTDLSVNFKLRGFIKSQLFTDEQAEAMYRAGFRWILVGFESGSERILENINKKATRAENTRCMEIARRNGLKVKALMSIGHAGESAETVQATKDWLLEVKPDDFDCTIISTYPGTPYFDQAIERTPGIWTYTCPKSRDTLHSREIDYSEEAQYYKGKVGEYVSYVHTDSLTGEDLVKLRDALESDVRAKLGIPFNQSSAAMRYEHSMGQAGPLPPHILKSSP